MSAASDGETSAPPGGDRRIRARDLWPSFTAAVSLIWRAAPVKCVGIPDRDASVGGHADCDRLAHQVGPRRPTTPHGAVGALALGLGTAGLGAAALPVFVRYGRAQIGRSASLVGTERLFAAAERQVGLRNFEDPAFLDRLRLAQEGTNRIAEIVDGIGGLLGGALSLIGFTGSLLILSPRADGPRARGRPPRARRRDSGPFPAAGGDANVGNRAVLRAREFFYSQLLTGLDAAKEIRLFGIGGFLRAG